MSDAEAQRRLMPRPSRQTPGFDTTSITSIVWLFIFVGVVYWFYSALKKIARLLEDIKKQLENAAQGGKQDVEKPH